MDYCKIVYHRNHGLKAVTLEPLGKSPSEYSSQSTRRLSSLRTQCNLPGAQDIEASSNRIIALEWLYRLSGRTNGFTPVSGKNSKNS